MTDTLIIIHESEDRLIFHQPERQVITSSRGAPGPAGQTGPQGSQGVQGIPGIPGIKGDTGDVGPAGAQGTQGVKGDKGDIGDAGPTGTDGVDGPQGPPGSDGEDGAQGLQGIQGPPGVDGEDGAQGSQGSPGVDGAQGIQGVKGDTGNTGPAGAVGATGAKGDKGDTGNTGAQGIQGPVGAAGADGIDGTSFETLRSTNKWYTQPVGPPAGNNASLPANRQHYTQFDIEFPCRITGVGVNAAAAVAGALVYAALFEDFDGWPGDRLKLSADQAIINARNVIDLSASPFLVPNPRRLWICLGNRAAGVTTSLVSMGTSSNPAVMPMGDTAWGVAVNGGGMNLAGDAPATWKGSLATLLAAMQSGSQVVRPFLRLEPL